MCLYVSGGDIGLLTSPVFFNETQKKSSTVLSYLIKRNLIRMIFDNIILYSATQYFIHAFKKK